ncbi:hypothetical protein AB0O01_36035 [Streptomyces sp. NPDC093252]|uniref:hypothetical protein n=1 Tax=Streptomyces sp. NPDC093252 TaxID=3154980 RepID=UPI00341AEAB7
MRGTGKAAHPEPGVLLPLTGHQMPSLEAVFMCEHLVLPHRQPEQKIVLQLGLLLAEFAVHFIVAIWNAPWDR